MEQFILRFRDRDDQACTTTFMGEFLGSISLDKNILRLRGIYRRTITWSVYRLGKTFLLHRVWVELLTRKWSGEVALYDDLPTLLSEIHKHVGREGPLAELRRRLLVASLATM